MYKNYIDDNFACVSFFCATALYGCNEMAQDMAGDKKNMYFFLNDNVQSFLLNYQSTFSGTVSTSLCVSYLLTGGLKGNDYEEKVSGRLKLAFGIAASGNILAEVDDVYKHPEKMIDYGDFVAIFLGLGICAGLLARHIKKISNPPQSQLKMI